MFFLARKFLRRIKTSETKLPENALRQDHVDDTSVATTKHSLIPDWEAVLTSSLKENCLAPADEVILHAFDLYCDELNKPVHERKRRMAGLFSEVTTEFAQLQSLAPDMVERAAAKHRLELNHFTDSKKDF